MNSAMQTHRAPNTLDEIARLVHENEQLKRERDRAVKRADVYKNLVTWLRAERNQLRSQLASRR